MIDKDTMLDARDREDRDISIFIAKVYTKLAMQVKTVSRDHIFTF